MRIFKILLLILLSVNCVRGQRVSFKGENSLLFSIGRGFDDGIVTFGSINIPTIGVGYEHGLNKFMAAYVKLSSYYRVGQDSYYDYISGRKIIDITDNPKLENYSSKNTIKALTIPLMIGTVFKPVVWRHHQISLYAGYGATYERYNWWKDYYLPAEITTTDGTVYPAVETAFTLQSEYRHIVLGENLGLSYSYQSRKIASGVFFGENNAFLAPANSSAFWDLSIFFKFKI